jgi:hypothetical protein
MLVNEMSCRPDWRSREVPFEKRYASLDVLGIGGQVVY